MYPIKELIINKELISINPKSSISCKFFNNNIIDLIEMYKWLKIYQYNIFDSMIYIILEKIETKYKDKHILFKIKQLLNLYIIYSKIKKDQRYVLYDMKENIVKYTKTLYKNKYKYLFEHQGTKKIVEEKMVNNLFDTIKLKNNYMLLDELYYFDDELKPRQRFKIIKVVKLTK